ncbi:hypothetical protein SLEP1_g29074 [Rubroshorea leprosula]|uniref:Uncharacterized protein n=1 Tax=Rubroshorea leprosula TaxID=152421 RepID=A0AAV5K4Y8_9ROSI|nr:hypothetical protein SLEP1_g29074 [Rubroshorea leprosula]
MLLALGDPLELVDGVCSDAGGLCSDAGGSRINVDEAFNKVGERKENNSDEQDGIFNEAGSYRSIEHGDHFVAGSNDVQNDCFPQQHDINNVEELEENEDEHGFEDFPDLSDNEDDETILTRDNLRHYKVTQQHADNINIVVQGEYDVEIHCDDEVSYQTISDEEDSEAELGIRRKARHPVFDEINTRGLASLRMNRADVFEAIWDDLGVELTPMQRKKTKDKLRNKSESVSNAEYSRMYDCFNALKKGFLTRCRRVIGLDGAFLKELRKDLFMADGSKFCIMFDQQKGLIKAMEELFPCAENRFYARHKYSNCRKQHKGKELQKAFWKCVKARTIPEFSKAMDELTSLKPSTRNTMLNTDPNHWILKFLSQVVNPTPVNDPMSVQKQNEENTNPATVQQPKNRGQRSSKLATGNPPAGAPHATIETPQQPRKRVKTTAKEPPRHRAKSIGNRSNQ